MPSFFISIFLVFSYVNAFSAQLISKKELIEILIKNQNIKLSEKKHIGCKNQKLGEYLALLITNGSEGDIHSLSSQCFKYNSQQVSFPPPKNLETNEVCELKAFNSDKKGMSPWTYSIRFVLNTQSKKIDSSKIDCPGSP